MRERDRVRIQHMLEASREALAVVEGRSRESLDEDRVLSLAVVRLIEIVGEAAAQVGEEARAQHPQVPWRDIVGMRNRLIHAYFRIDHDLVWNTLEEDLPLLMKQLERILDEEHAGKGR